MNGEAERTRDSDRLPPADRIPHSRPTVVPGMEDAVARVVRSGQHAGGAERRAFESELARRIGARAGVAVQSGSAALHVALLALEVRPGDAVVLPSYVCMAVLNAVTACGARAILTDVHPQRLNPDVSSIKRALARESVRSSDVRAAIVPHMVGSPSDIRDIRELGFPIIEDCAMALGARLHDEEVGAWGVISTFSFYATKMISTGQGGMLLTSDPELERRARDLIQYDNREAWTGTTWNYPLTDIAAALGREQLSRVDVFLERRAELAEHYRDFAQRRGLRFQEHLMEAAPNYYRFVIFPEERDELRAELESRGIETKPPVFRPIHRYLGLSAEEFPGCESAHRSALSLPIYPSLTDDAVRRVIDALERAK